jgi:predicted Zn-dependent protease
MSAILPNLLKLINTPRDGALLRYSIGNEYLKLGNTTEALIHLREAVERDPNYSAAWKVLGKTLTETGALQDALAAYRSGIAVATQRGDRQAVKEMSVFARRLEKQLGSGADS